MVVTKRTNITREQKKQVDYFLQQIYGFDFKTGSAYLCGAGFDGQKAYSSLYVLRKQALYLIQNTGEAYISLNIFKSRQGYCRRAEKYLWRFNHIVIDIDFQQDFSPDYEAVEQELERQIRWHSTYGDAPMPNAIVFTGSGGCHLYYIFEDLPNGKKGRMAEGIQAVKMQLLARWVPLEKSLQEEGLDFHVDTQAVDASRVFRVPGSSHRDTGRMCRMKPLRLASYGYKELCRCISDIPWNGDYAVVNARRDIERMRFGYGQSERRSKPYTMTKQFLGAKRLRELLRLAHAGWGFQNCRELAAHFAWVWGRDAELSEDEIRDKLLELNACFYRPLSEKELFYTAKGNGKSYRYTNVRIRLTLGLDDSEGYFTGRRSREYKDRAGTTRRHKKWIAALVLAGKKIREIAQELHLSVSLVKRRRTEMKKAEGFTFWAAVPI